MPNSSEPHTSALLDIVWIENGVVRQIDWAKTRLFDLARNEKREVFGQEFLNEERFGEEDLEIRYPFQVEIHVMEGDTRQDCLKTGETWLYGLRVV